MEKDEILKTYQADLSDKQSVRTTFRLSQKAYDDIVWLADHHDITLKDAFDVICSQLESLQGSDSFIERLAQSIQSDDSSIVNDAIRKTHVITKKSLRILDELSKKYQISRDALAEMSIRMYRFIVESSIQKTRENHEKALKIISEFDSHAQDIEYQLKKLLGDDDPVYHRFGFITILTMNLQTAIEHELRDGTPIDPDDF